jgi:eukaryotic-like serine/threonine-protein kinase
MPADGELLERLRREVLLSQMVADERCCRVLEMMTLEGAPVLKMELIDGWTLSDLVRRARPLPLQLALSIALLSAGACAALHRNGVLHRDVKASNLMLTRQGQIKVMDLGISWSADLSSLTVSGTLLGTPSYMAPELILQQGASLRSDVYSLGALAYFLLTGRLPFSAGDLVQLFLKQVQEAPKPPRQLRPELSEAVEALLLRCLQKDPDQRPQDAAELEKEWLACGVTAQPADVLAAIFGLPEPRSSASASFGGPLGGETVRRPLTGP